MDEQSLYMQRARAKDKSIAKGSVKGDAGRQKVNPAYAWKDDNRQAGAG